MVESIITVGLEVIKCLAPPIEGQINYLRNYTSNVEKLREGIKKLKDDGENVQHAVNDAKRNGEVIENNVLEWLGSVNDAIVEAEQFIGDEAIANNRCFQGCCPNLNARIQRSNEAVTRLEVVSNLRNDRGFTRISYRPSLENIRLSLSEYIEAFESRKSILKDILDALKNPDVNVVGICGLGGIGKTTLAQVVAKQVESDKLFDQVVFAEVSQSPDIKKIQEEIADQLGVKFEEATDLGKANKLSDRLKKEKILLILDNIWDGLAFGSIGIPHGDHHKGCKILLTARSEDTLSRKMDCQQNFQIGVLDDEEAWRLFKKMAGEYIESSQYKSIATDVVRKCGGLPISLVTVARALRNKTTSEWRDAMLQLERPSASTNYRNIQKEAYSAIELSYNHLESEELRKVFLLLGYTYIGEVDDLLEYGVGLGIFEGIGLMAEARDRVRALVNKLEASCMLLDCEYWFSMHDVVRDVAIAIASEKGELYIPWKSSDEKLYTSMVLRDIKTNVFSEASECSRLKLLSISGDRFSSIMIPDLFFTKMTQLRVLALTDMDLQSLPSSLGHLTKLQTLCMKWCNVEDVAVVGGLKMLKILRINHMHNVMKLPKEIGELTQLRLLDLRGCSIKVIPPNVLSKLSLLEELYIYDFEEWEEEVEEGLKNASPDELKHLPHLTTLELCIINVNILPKDLFFEKLERYNIHIGLDWVKPRIEWKKSCGIFQLALNTNISLKDGMIVQLKGVEELTLYGLQEEDMNYLASELLLKGGFLQLKLLKLRDCAAPNISTGELKKQGSVFPNLQFLSVEIKHMPWICQTTEDFFCKLKYLHVDLDESSKKNRSLLDDLLSRFLFHTVKFLQIFGTSGITQSGGRKVLSEAEGVIRYVNEFCDIKHVLKPSGFLHNLEKLEIYDLECDNLINLLPSSTSFDNLTTLYLWSCSGFKKLLPSSTARSLVQLRRMTIDYSRTITEVVADDEGESEAKDEIVFKELQELTLESLSSLTSFCSGNRPFRFPSLEKLVVNGCLNMKIFCEGELSTPMLQEVWLSKYSHYMSALEGDLNTTIEKLYLERRKEGEAATEGTSEEKIGEGSKASQ